MSTAIIPSKHPHQGPRPLHGRLAGPQQQAPYHQADRPSDRIPHSDAMGQVRYQVDEEEPGEEACDIVEPLHVEYPPASLTALRNCKLHIQPVLSAPLNYTA